MWAAKPISIPAFPLQGREPKHYAFGFRRDRHVAVLNALRFCVKSFTGRFNHAQESLPIAKPGFFLAPLPDRGLRLLLSAVRSNRYGLDRVKPHRC